MNSPAQLKPISGEIFAALGRSRRSIADLASSVGMSESTMRRRLAEPSKLNLEEVLTIAQDLGLKPHDLTKHLLESVSPISKVA